MGVSSVTLNGIALDIDPDNYVLMSGRRRGSVHPLVDGGTVIQDRGLDQSDMRIQLSGTLTDVTTLKALYALYRKTSYTFTFADFKSNSFTVCFLPGTESFVASPIKGSNRAFSYTIQLAVVTVDTWFGVVGGYPATT